MDQSCELVAWIHFCLPNIISSTNRPSSTSATRFAHGSATTNDSRATAITAATRGATRPTGGKGLQLLQAHGLVFFIYFSGVVTLPFLIKTGSKPVWTGSSRIEPEWKNGRAKKTKRKNNSVMEFPDILTDNFVSEYHGLIIWWID